MGSVTIDRLPVGVHKRYAEDQTNLETISQAERTQVLSHAEALGTSSIYESQVDVLFAAQASHMPWAYFAPPPFMGLRQKHCFGHTVASGVDIKVDLLDAEVDVTIQGEKQRLALFSLMEEMNLINAMLGQIHKEKSRYQKG